ncbi:MAG: tRNA (cytidine(34)-2'-O)-methyltransferase [Desulfomonile tiedjei]|uniref:Putative tRNA (cytidine(34)-2'-O)-methyltransferase n=1 Tax=Desulfomonile tiedjei TaxID=2358 RepID=A0A9D6Z7S7_9BACT|nr:tRNA (cytidine(34)-2'-O)-methyltransferase [Desulfomonile tiedjei]
MLNVVLINPEIPPNTGNIGRLCCAVGARLHLVKPLGFRLEDRYLKRAGLDYWDKLDLAVWNDLETYLAATCPVQMVLTSSKRGEIYHNIGYKPGDHILFGPETTGLSMEMFERFPARIARIPIDLNKVRSLNLSTAAGIVVYEALRKIGELPEL